MSNNVRRLMQRVIAAFTAITLGTSLTILSLLTPVAAHAFTASGGQLQSRAVYMSTSTPGATSVSYIVSFKPTATTAIQGIIVDFCSGSPIIGDSGCTQPSGMSLGTPTVSTAALTAGTNSPISTTALPTAGWTASTVQSGRALKLINASNSTAMTVGTTYGFVISTVTNPTQATAATSGTFYARVLTYNSSTGDIASYAAGTEGSTNLVDYGGIAMSTAYNIQITAKVQESLSFCTSAADLSGSSANTCAAATNPILTLGHGAPAVLSNTAIDMTSAYTQASTNASSGLAIRMHATNTCSGLSSNSGTSCQIAGANNTAAATQTAGTTFFGLMVGPSALTGSTASSSGTITPDNNYNVTGSTTPTAISGTAASNAYGMDNTVNSGVNSTYGDLIASSTAPVSQVNNQLAFAATAGLTVPAGIYTGNESLIATGTF